MKPVHTPTSLSFALTFLCLLGGQPANTQQPITGTGTSITSSSEHHDPFGMSETSAATQHNLEKIRQTERQRRMIADTNRLLALTADLKASLDKAAQGQPPADLLKKTEEIEKLARSVKDRMKG